MERQGGRAGGGKDARGSEQGDGGEGYYGWGPVRAGEAKGVGGRGGGQ